MTPRLTQHCLFHRTVPGPRVGQCAHWLKHFVRGPNANEIKGCDSFQRILLVLVFNSLVYIYVYINMLYMIYRSSYIIYMCVYM